MPTLPRLKLAHSITNSAKTPDMKKCNHAVWTRGCATCEREANTTTAPYKVAGLWRKEFGDGFAIPSGITGNPRFNDISWHNDMCPSFAVDVDPDAHTKGRYIVVWAEHPEASERELKMKRYLVCWRDNDGNGDDILETDDVEEAVRVALAEADKLKRVKYVVRPDAFVAQRVTGGLRVVWDDEGIYKFGEFIADADFIGDHTEVEYVPTNFEDTNPYNQRQMAEEVLQEL
jgi:hypothetical protein